MWSAQPQILDVRHSNHRKLFFFMDLPGTVPVSSVPGRSMHYDAHLRASHRTSLFVTIATGRIGTDLPKQPGSDVRCDGWVKSWMCVIDVDYCGFVMDLPGTMLVLYLGPGRSMQHDAHLRASHRTSLFVTIATGRIGTDLPKQPGSDVQCV